MSDIHQLDPITIGQIAAGEIIERPISVVKELVENAVDAGATRVSVQILHGGIEAIEVIDDGSGIDSVDLPLAARRHATSKLSAADDLESIATLGFRGEGLASIAAVARVTLLSRVRGAQIGSQVIAHAENISDVEPAPAPLGTRVVAEALFENVPVRREYLKSPSAEFSRISGWLTSFSLAYPHISFSLRHDGKDVWVMPASTDPRERLARVFGREAAASMIAIDENAVPTIDGKLFGFVSLPGHDRADRRMQILFVNGRLLHSTLLAGAWIAGYSTFAMSGRHPYGVLYLQLPPEHVDPNVHPTKSDVRLRFGHQVFDAVKRAIATTLQHQATERFREHVAPGTISFSPTAVLNGDVMDATSLFKQENEIDGERNAESSSQLRVLAQLDATFILATDGSSLLLIDQHAAHERIAYEAIVASAREHAPSEALLVPFVIELDAAQSIALDRTLEVLRQGGLDIEAFGERTYRVRATPAGYGARQFDLVGFIDELSKAGKGRDVHERVWASLACHSVTVAGERLAMGEMTTLVDRLQCCANPMHCPHGRPTMVRLLSDDIARMFKRI